jgi:hypothetical protein
MFADYFSIGDQTHYTVAYRKWVTFGYQHFLNSGGFEKQACSYRFWSKGDSNTALAVGLLQSSSDNLRRPFPLLLIGTGQFPCWQKMWHAFPDTFKNVWTELEKIAGERYQSPGDIATDFAKISPPALSEHQGVQPCPEAIPNAVFTGGCGGKNTVFRFTGPLTAQDFIQLWSFKTSLTP